MRVCARILACVLTHSFKNVLTDKLPTSYHYMILIKQQLTQFVTFQENDYLLAWEDAVKVICLLGPDYKLC